MPSDKSRCSIACLFIPGMNSREYFPCTRARYHSAYAHQPNNVSIRPSAETIKNLRSRFTSLILNLSGNPRMCCFTPVSQKVFCETHFPDTAKAVGCSERNYEAASQGLMVAAPIPLESFVFRVTTWTGAVVAINESKQRRSVVIHGRQAIPGAWQLGDPQKHAPRFGR
jgi:hypothetical protein